MAYLLPIGINYEKISSRMSFDFSIAFNNSIIHIVKRSISPKRLENIQTKVITNVAITAITCVAIAISPKIIALGCVAISAIAYNVLARKVQNSEVNLLHAMHIQKVNNLFIPKLNKHIFTLLNNFSDIRDLDPIRDPSQQLEKNALDALVNKRKKLDGNQAQFKQKLSYLETKLLLEDSQEGSSEKRRLEMDLDRLGKGLDLSQVNLLLENLTPLIKDSTQNINDLQSIQEDLKDLKEDFNLKETLLEEHTKELINAEDLHKKLETLHLNSSFFKENGALLDKTGNIFLKIYSNIVNKRSVCRNFMFYSLSGTALIKLGFSLAKASKVNWATARLINQCIGIGNPYLIITALGGLAIVYAVKNALNLITHRNDEVKKQDLLSTITADEKTVLSS